MDVDGRPERLGAGEHRLEVGVIEEPAADGPVGHAAGQTVVAHGALQLVRRRLRAPHRQRGEGAEAVRMALHDLLWRSSG